MPASVPLPRCPVTSSLSQGMSPALWAGALATAFAVAALPSTSHRCAPLWRARLRHRPLEVLVDRVEKTGGGEPFVIGAHQQREVLGHETRLDRRDGHLLQGGGELRKL